MKKLLLGLTIILFVASFAFSASYEVVKVKNGESLKTIATKYLKSANMTKALLKFNGLNSARDIKAGMSLKVPYSISKKRVAKLSFKVGDVEYKNGKTWKNVKKNQILIQSDVIRTKSGSKANITLDDGTIIKMGPKSKLSLANYAYDGKSRKTNLNLAKGSAAFNVTKLTKKSNFNVSSVTAVAGVRGTKFFMGVNEEDDVDLSVYQGSVEVVSTKNADKPQDANVILNSGYATRINAAGTIEKPFPIPGKIEWADEE